MPTAIRWIAVPPCERGYVSKAAAAKADFAVGHLVGSVGSGAGYRMSGGQTDPPKKAHTAMHLIHF